MNRDVLDLKQGWDVGEEVPKKYARVPASLASIGTFQRFQRLSLTCSYDKSGTVICNMVTRLVP